MRYYARKFLIAIVSIILLMMVSFSTRQLYIGKYITHTPPSESQSIKTWLKEDSILKIRHGLHLPTFYFSVHSLNRRMLNNMDKKYQRLWPFAQRFAVNENIIQSINLALNPKLNEEEIEYHLNKIYNNPKTSKGVHQDIALANEGLKPIGLMGILPQWQWNGRQNQFHHWLFGNPHADYASKGILFGDFGKSLYSGQKTTHKIGQGLKWTLIINGLSLLLIISGSFWMGLFWYYFKKDRPSYLLQPLLFFAFSIPSFFMATMLVQFLCNPDYLHWFPPAVSLHEEINGGFVMAITSWIPYIVLPIFCISYPSVVYLSTQFYKSLQHQGKEIYATTGKMKGLSFYRLIRGHLSLNAFLPIIPLLSTSLPFIFSGALIIEVIFSIPGMGKLVYHAFLEREIHICTAVVFMMGFLTITSTLLADMVLHAIDKRLNQKMQWVTK